MVRIAPRAIILPMKFFRFMIRALLLLMVALISALTAMRFAIHGREVSVPDLVGKTPAEASRMARERGFEFEVERQYYSDTVKEGEILSQLPPVGTLVRRGWEIRVAESLGPQRVQIPDVVGQSERAAQMNIQRRGLNIGATAQMPSSGQEAGLVLAQSPPPNASGVAAPKISLLLAEPAPPPAFVMPSFIGQQLNSAKLILQTSGLRLGTVTETPSTAAPAVATPAGVLPAATPPPPQTPSPSGIIMSQTPAPGEKVLAGSAINFEVR
jgi:beta-lactam-binding protein with PASTA domain